MRFTETTVFVKLLAPMDAEESELLAQIDRLAGTIERKKSANAAATKKKDEQKFRADEIRMEAAQKRLADIHFKKGLLFSGSSLTHYEMCQIRAEMHASSWSQEAKATLALPRFQHEGRGEKAVRMMRGLSLVVTQGKRDMDDGEIKWMDNDHGGTQTMQVCRSGTVAVGGFIFSLTDKEKATLDPRIRAAIIEGELQKELLEGRGEAKMPTELLIRLAGFVLPSEVLNDYGDIYAAFNFGYVVVPHTDADDAWSLVSITKGRPRYALRKSYSLKKMLDESA